jgi:hypothetical protein
MGFGTMPGKVVPRVPLRHGEGNKDHLTSFGGLAALSLDALSSVAYGPEVIVLALVAAGPSALGLTLPVTLAISGLLVVLVVSYCQVIAMHPGGGGAYAVGKEDLGARSCRTSEDCSWRQSCAPAPTSSSAPSPTGSHPDSQASEWLTCPAKRLAPRGVRRIILRSGIMAVRHLPAAADPCVRAFVASHGMGGTVPSREESGRAVGVPGYGMGGTVPSGDESARALVTGSGWGAAGLDMCLPFTCGVGCRIAIGHHGVSDSRNTATEKNADAYRRRARSASTADAAVAGLGGRHPGGHAVARPGSWPGNVDQIPAESAEARHCERLGQQRS